MEISATSPAGRPGARLPIWVRIFLILAVVAPVALFATAAYQDWMFVVREARGRLLHQRDALAEHAARVLKTQELVAIALSDRVNGQTWSEISKTRALYQFVQSLEMRFPELLAIWMIDGDGNVRLGSDGFPPPPTNVSQRPYFQDVRGGAPSVMSGRYRPRYAVDEGFTFALRRERDGRFDGTVGVAVRVGYFTEFYRSAVPDGSAVALMHADGRLLVRYPEVPLPERIPPTSPFMRDVQSTDMGDGLVQSPVDGRMRYYAFRRVADTPIIISYAILQDELISKWRARVGLYGAYVFPGLALLTALSVLTWRTFATLDQTVQQRTSALAAALDEKGRALADRETLLQEVHHRVKNNLQIVSSLVRMQARVASDPEDTVRRILAMALVHELIYAMPGSFAQIDLGDYTRRLTQALQEANDSAVEVRTDADSMTVDLDRALPFGLILNEVVTAAMRQAKPVRGRVVVSLRPDEPGQGLLRVATDPPDGHLPLADDETFGLRLIERISVQIEARIDSSGIASSVFVMRFPLSNTRVSRT